MCEFAIQYESGNVGCGGPMELGAAGEWPLGEHDVRETQNARVICVSYEALPIPDEDLLEGD